MKTRFLELDLIRAAAVLLVIIGHSQDAPGFDISSASPIVQGLMRGGWVGVNLFFVLSGFLVGGLIFKEYRESGKVNIGRFLIRRGFKIYPPFYFMIILSIFWPLSGEIPAGSQVLHEVIYVQNYFPGVFGHTWSLAVEEHFYFLLALCALLLLSFRKTQPFKPLIWIIPAIGFFCLSLRWINAEAYPTFNTWIHYRPTQIRIDALAFGVLIAYAYNFHQDRFRSLARRFRWPLLIVGILLMIPVFLTDQSKSPAAYSYGYSILYLSSGMIMVASLAFHLPRTFPINLFGQIGVLSYSIYLWHIPVISFMMPILQAGRYWVPEFQIPFVIVLCVLVGSLFGVAIERPFLVIRDMVSPSAPKHTRRDKLVSADPAALK